jgi:uncharacterized membrane protein (UPF0127 family)
VKKFFFLSIVLFPLFLGSLEELIPITVEHAITDVERTKGLMHRTHLPPDHGMLFKYERPQRISIWMYNTMIDLAVAFLDQNKVIREIHELKAYPEIKDRYFFHLHAKTASFEASYALEMNRGWFKEHAVKPGDQLLCEPLASHAKILKTNAKH